jgi:hypothetical protein
MMPTNPYPANFGNRLVPQLYSEWNDLRRLIRQNGDPEIQAALDKVEEHIDFAFQQNAGRKRDI